MSTDLLASLNESQRKAALHGSGPCVVFSGAGSGKTRVISTRIARLIESGIPAWQILAVTFTNKAAKEMKERVEAICPQGRSCLITTFHSACARWLREFCQHLGFDANFVIYDDNDSTQALKKVLQKLNPKGDIPTILPVVKSFIQACKTKGILPHELENSPPHFLEQAPTGIAEIYHKYQEFLAGCNAMDFSDLLLHVLLLLRRNATVRSELQNRYRYILVDEFQDTNRVQFELLNILSERNRNLFVVGDDDQSIYSWRGAVPSNIIDFDKLFPDAVRYTLEQNYRCTSNIVDAAAAMITHNKYRTNKKLFTHKDKGDLIDYIVEYDAELEASCVVRSVLEEKGRFPLEEVAIFYRTNSQSRVLEEALRRENVPYTIFGSLEFYSRLEIKDLISYFRVMVNPSDEVSLRRIINVPTRGIGDRAVQLVENHMIQTKTPMLGAIRDLVSTGIPKLSGKLAHFLKIIDDLTAKMRVTPLEDMPSLLIDTIDYATYLKKKFPDQYLDKLDNVQELASAIADYAQRNPSSNLPEWLHSITLIQSENTDENTSTGVSLMTLHMAKGLEFDRVFICGFEDGLLPHKNSLEDRQKLEEERRLLYVGMTRAKQKLSLLKAQCRKTYKLITSNDPSRFLPEIPSQYLNMANTDMAMGQSFDESYYDYEDSAAELRKGSVVYHPTYGKGTIEDFDFSFGKHKVIVNFRDFGYRKIVPAQLMHRGF
ncbi:MAG: ATP-dependent helicase [Oligoflexales bacterium]